MATNSRSSIWITPTSRAFIESVDALRTSFVDGKGVPLCLTCAKEGNSAFFTSTTATTLLALHYIDKLSDELCRRFQETILLLKSEANVVYSGRVEHVEEAAWDAAEGASPWITGLAIWALLGTGYKGDQLNEIKRSALWLVDQRQENGGWGRYPDDLINLFTTGIVLHALRCVITPSSGINLTETELRKINKASTNTIELIRKSGHRSGKSIYWEEQIEERSEADPTATLCAIWALNEANDPQDEDKELIKGGQIYLRQTLHDSARMRHPGIWTFRHIVVRAPVHGPAMTIVTFTPSFVIPLLAMKCDPFDDICFAPIQWFHATGSQKNRAGDTKIMDIQEGTPFHLLPLMLFGLYIIGIDMLLFVWPHSKNFYEMPDVSEISLSCSLVYFL